MVMPLYGSLAASAGMLGASGPSRMPTGIGGILGAGISGYLQGAPMDMAAQRQQGATDARERIAGKLTPRAVQAAWTQGAHAAGGAPMLGYLNKLAMSESGNKNIGQQVNDSGTAFGPFQFTKGTWDDVIAAHPDLGLTPADRFLPEAQGKAITAFTNDNAKKLTDAFKRRPSLVELVMAHRFGAGGAIQLLSADRNTSVARVLPDAAAANPQWAKMTVGDIINDSAKAVGAGKGVVDTGGVMLASAGDIGGMLGGSAKPSSGGDDASSLLAGMLAPAEKPKPVGSAIDDITPEFRDILKIALTSGDPEMGMAAVNALLQIGTSQPGRGGKGADVPEKAVLALMAGLRPGTPEWQAALVGGEKNTSTSAQKDAEALGLVKGTTEYNDYIRQRTLPQPDSVHVEQTVAPQLPETEKEASKSFGKGLGELAGNLVTTAPKRIAKMEQVNAMERMLGRLEASGRDPGKWQSFKTEMERAYYTALGKEIPADIQDFRAFSSMVNRDILNFIGADNGGIPASGFSDRDMQAVKAMAASADDDPMTLRAKLSVIRAGVNAENFLQKEIMQLRKSMPMEDAVMAAMEKAQSRDFLAEEPAVKAWMKRGEDAQQGGAAPSATPPAAMQPSQKAIDYLRKNPGLRGEFDKKYGTGAAARALGQ